MKLPSLLLILSMFVSCAATPSKRTIFEHTVRSIIHINFLEGESGSFCTGFIIDSAKGLALTAKHCVPEKPETKLYVNEKIEAEVVKTTDSLALIKIPVMMGPPLELAKEGDVTDDVQVIGFGYGSLKVLQRHIASWEGDDIVVDGPISPGMSGGPMVNSEGKVVAITQATAPAIGAGCSYKELRKFLKG